MATVTELLTAAEFGSRPDPGYPEELVQGRIVTMPPPTPRHGQICGETY
jgi:Uma2 family endonuclease